MFTIKHAQVTDLQTGVSKTSNKAWAQYSFTSPDGLRLHNLFVPEGVLIDAKKGDKGTLVVKVIEKAVVDGRYAKFSNGLELVSFDVDPK